MEGEDIIEAEYYMSKLVGMVVGQRIKQPSLDLKAELLDSQIECEEYFADDCQSA